VSARERIFCAQIRKLWADLRDPAKNPDLLSCDGCLLRSSRVQMGGFHDLFRQKPSCLFITLGWSSISITSLTIRSMYLGLLERMAVWCTWMPCSKLTLCHATDDFFRCRRWCSFHLVPIERIHSECCILPASSIPGRPSPTEGNWIFSWEEGPEA
jgi:hypothetical protein